MADDWPQGAAFSLVSTRVIMVHYLLSRSIVDLHVLISALQQSDSGYTQIQHFPSGLSQDIESSSVYIVGPGY